MDRERGAEAPLSHDRSGMSELRTQRELQLTWMRRTIWEWPVANRSVLVDVAAGAAEVDMVDDIERIHTELDRCHLADGEVLLNRQVHIEQVRSKDAVPSDVSDLIQAGHGEGGAQGLRLEVDQAIAGEAGDMRLERAWVSVDLARHAARYLITARAIAERKGKAAGVVEHWTKLPSSDDLVDDPVCVGKQRLVVPEG